MDHSAEDARPGDGGPGGRPGPLASAAEARFLSPMLAQQAPEAVGSGGPALPGGEGRWILEPKLDGLRGLAVRNGQRAELLSRNRLPFSHRFPAVLGAVQALPADNFVLDGEVVALDTGQPDFGVLQQGNARHVEYWVFDLLWLLGRDVRHLPIEQRRVLLEKMVVPGPVLKLVPVLCGPCAGLLEKACSQGTEGLMAKKRGSLYAEGRSSEWLKLKCGCRQELVVGGFTAPQRSRAYFGALLLGYWEAGELRYAGKVGTGFTGGSLRQIHSQLTAMSRPTPPFSEPVKEKGAQWTEPVLVAEVAFSNWTADGRLRHPSFLGLRPDKEASSVGREPAVPAVRRGPGAPPGA